MPGNSFKNKELAAAAGRKSGKPKRIKQWEQLGDFLTEKGAERAMRILANMSDEDYLDQYGKLLNYFKPRMQSTAVQTKGEINIKITEPE